MRSLVLSAFGRIDVGERESPVPGPGEVVLDVVATGICGSDVHGFTGENGRREIGQVMGHETVGRIAALGPRVTGLGLEIGRAATVNPVVIPDADREAYAGREQHCPGKYVIGVRPDVDAAFADRLLAPARNVLPLPEGMPILLGALVEPLAVAVHALNRVRPEPTERVLVIGGGPIGQSVALCLTLRGIANVVVTEIDAQRRDLLARLGVATLDPRSPDVASAVSAALGGPADVAIDAVGTDRSLADALVCTRLGGRVCLVGMGSPRVSVDAFRISTDERTVIGSFTYSDDDFREALAMAAADPGQTSLLLSRTVSPEDADAAFRAAASATAPPGKTLVQFRE